MGIGLKIIMKKKLLCFLLIAFFFSGQLFSQTDTTNKRTFKVAVFAPMYLDSVFSNTDFITDRTIPKFIMPAVDFVQGAQIAFDTLLLFDNEKVEANIYDTKSYSQNIPWLISNRMLDSVDLIIGSVKEQDFKDLADFSLKKNIPFISATYPNDGGVTGNPFLAIMNSTLKAHCEGIYSYILQNHGTDKILLCKKHGPQEDKIANYFKAINEQEGKPLLNIQVLNFDSTISTSYIRSKLDSTHNSVIIGASLDEDFARDLADVCYTITKKKYPITLIGMPNWDGFRSFVRKDAYKDFPIHYTTPYYNAKSGVYNTLLTSEYNRRYKSKPSDMAYKGFECAYFFTRLLLKYPDDFLSHLNDKTFTVFNDFNFRPVYSNKKSSVPNYLREQTSLCYANNEWCCFQ